MKMWRVILLCNFNWKDVLQEKLTLTLKFISKNTLFAMKIYLYWECKIIIQQFLLKVPLIKHYFTVPGIVLGYIILKDIQLSPMTILKNSLCDWKIFNWWYTSLLRLGSSYFNILFFDHINIVQVIPLKRSTGAVRDPVLWTEGSHIENKKFWDLNYWF